MSTTTPTHRHCTDAPPPGTTATPVVNNRPTYLAWGAAWLVGQGAFALAHGPDPLVAMPALLPGALLAAGVLVAAVVTGVVTARSQRGVTGPAKTTGTLIGAAWAIGFTALFLLITATDRLLDGLHVPALLWPAGTGLVVGLVYLLGGTAQRDLLQYALGGWLALTATAGAFLGLPGLYWVVALAGGGGYLTAAALENRAALARQHA